MSKSDEYQHPLANILPGLEKDKSLVVNLQRYEQTKVMAAEYEAGDNLVEIAEKYNMTAAGVGYRLRKFGVKMRPRFGRNANDAPKQT